MSRSSTIAALAVALTTAATAAYAAGAHENDALAIKNAQIPLTQAVQAAEQKVGGQAVHAQYEQTQTGWAYDVEVVNGQNVFDVTVDAKDGSVIASAQDKTDRNEDRDEGRGEGQDEDQEHGEDSDMQS